MPTIKKHIVVLQSEGYHSVIYELKGRIDLKRLGRHFNMMVKRKHPDVTKYHFFWFRTQEGVIVSYVGNMFLLDAVQDFMSKATQIGIASTADEVFSGRSKELFMGKLRQCLTQFTPKPYSRSYGGSQLR
ncbi:hypothetical protein V2I85_12215 [Pseudomonas viridiflava]|uniref:hypothetical protein n=1 Tax=Pseudomonas viridiflava TaxID=33069 RepID=UPI002EA9B710|nr:hypothetical protein [Pseudomonas viridiflava]